MHKRSEALKRKVKFERKDWCVSIEGRRVLESDRKTYSLTSTSASRINTTPFIALTRRFISSTSKHFCHKKRSFRLDLCDFQFHFAIAIVCYLFLLFFFHFFTGLGPCLPNNLSTYGARRFHISRSEWDRVFSRLTVVPGLSFFPIDEQEGKWNYWIFWLASGYVSKGHPSPARHQLLWAHLLCWLPLSRRLLA